MQDFKRLLVWKKAHEMTLSVYRMTETFPSEERFGLTSQLRRSCASIPANIAEGCGRGGNKELSRFLQIALGSAKESEYHLLLAKDLKYITREVYNEADSKLDEVKRMLSGFVKTVSSEK